MHNPPDKLKYHSLATEFRRSSNCLSNSSSSSSDQMGTARRHQKPPGNRLGAPRAAQCNRGAIPPAQALPQRALEPTDSADSADRREDPNRRPFEWPPKTEGLVGEDAFRWIDFAKAPELGRGDLLQHRSRPVSSCRRRHTSGAISANGEKPPVPSENAASWSRLHAQQTPLHPGDRAHAA